MAEALSTPFLLNPAPKLHEALSTHPNGTHPERNLAPKILDLGFSVSALRVDGFRICRIVGFRLDPDLPRHVLGTNDLDDCSQPEQGYSIMKECSLVYIL